MRSAITRRSSFLLEDLGKQLFDSNVSIIDNPLVKRGLRSRPFDGEGLATHKTALIDKGVLMGWLLDSASARQLGAEPTGHASRGTGGAPGVSVTNVYMRAGTASPRDLMHGIARGIYVTELIGMGVNPVTGDYSRGASGFLIENGVAGYDVSSWQGLVVPAGTPQAAIDRLHAAVVKVLAQPAVKEAFAKQGAQASPTSPEQLQQYVRAEVARWKKVATDAGVKPQ